MAILSIWISQSTSRTTLAFAFRSVTCSTKLPTRTRTTTLAVAASDWSSTTCSMSTTTTSKEQPILDPLIVCGPSGVGKGTIIERFMASDLGRSRFGFSTSHTTRAPREGEIDRVHYNFVTRDEMNQLIDLGKFLEHAQVHGNVYGTSWEALRKIQEQGRICLLDIDVQGVKRVKALQQQQQQQQQQPISTSKSDATVIPKFKPKYVFIAPPSMEILERRLIGRGTESEESLQKRTKNAREEVEYGLEEGNFDFVLVNDDLDKTCQEFDALVRKLYGL